LWFSRTFAGAICLVLAGCGFQPLYGTRGDRNIIADFSAIQVAPVRDRIGQLLHNELEQLLHPRGVAPDFHYRLTANLSESSGSLAVKKSAFATRANLTVTASYSLTDARTGESPITASTSITVSYNIFQSKFETLTAEQNARQRAIRELAQEIRIRLGVFLGSPARVPARTS